MMAMDDFLKLRCKNCHHEFNTVRAIISISIGNVKCPVCGYNKHDILEEDKHPDFLPKTFNISTTRNTSSDLYDSLLYAVQQKQKMDEENSIRKYFFNTEDLKMKRTEIERENDKNITITRRCDTSRGIFTVGQLEPTDMFVLIDDEDQTVYMAVYEEEPKYKTKQAVVDMQSGNLLYLDLAMKIHVYKSGCELRVGEFIWTSEGYN